jgi:hypothetical protein
MLSMATCLVLAAAPVDLESWNTRRLATNRTAMFVLGGWAVANMAVGAIGYGLERDERLRWLHLGNAAWNVVNLGLAVVGLVSDWGRDPKSFDAKQSLVETEKQEKVLLVNAGLDVAYLAAAAFLWQRGDATSDQRLVGLGQALLIQGAFLLGFDITLAVLSGRLTDELLLGIDVMPGGGAGVRAEVRW